MELKPGVLLSPNPGNAGPMPAIEHKVSNVNNPVKVSEILLKCGVVVSPMRPRFRMYVYVEIDRFYGMLKLSLIISFERGFKLSHAFSAYLPAKNIFSIFIVGNSSLV